jgi:hypothetical protein
MNGGYYTRWIAWAAGQSGKKLNLNDKTVIVKYTDFGLLLPNGSAGDGHVFYCPSLNAKNSILGSMYYEPILTFQDSSPADGNGNVRGSYVVNPTTNAVAGGNLRLYDKATKVQGRVVFGMDFIDGNQFDSSGNVLIQGVNFAHSRSKGWNMLFSDASVEFKKVPQQQMQAMYVASDWPTATGYDIVGINKLILLFEQ